MQRTSLKVLAWVLRALRRGWRWLHSAQLPRAVLAALGLRAYASVPGTEGVQRAGRDARTSSPADGTRVPSVTRRRPQQVTAQALALAPASALGPARLLRQKTVSPHLVEQLASALVLVQSVGLDLGSGVVLPPSALMRSQHLCNRVVRGLSGELLLLIRSAVEQLEAVGYADRDVRGMLLEQSPMLAWLRAHSLSGVRLASGASDRPLHALRGKVSKWYALQSAKVKAKLGPRGSAPPAHERKVAQAELVDQLRASAEALVDAIQIGLAEAEEDMCAICFERPRTLVLQHARRRDEDRHQVCETCLAHLMQTNARCPFCNEAVAYG